MKDLLAWVIPLPLKKRRFFDYKILSSWYFLGLLLGILLSIYAVIAVGVVASAGGLLSTVLIVLPSVSIIYGYVSYLLLKTLRAWRPSKYPGYVWLILPLIGPFTMVIGILLIILLFKGKKFKKISSKQVKTTIDNSTVGEFKEEYGDLLKDLVKKGVLAEEEIAMVEKLLDFSDDEASLMSLFDDIAQDGKEDENPWMKILVKLLEEMGWEVYYV
jgi:hypothetical protein